MAQPLYPTSGDKEWTYCVATLSYNKNVVLKYIEQNKPLSKEHITLFNELRSFVDAVLSKKVIWKLSKISPKLLQIVDNNYKHHDEIYATNDMYSYLQKYATIQTLIACCIGSNYNIYIAKQCILDIVQWRTCSKIDNINPILFKNSLETKTVYNTHQFDKLGHPICHFKVLETPPDDPWMIVRAAVYTIEKCIKLAEKNNLYQILWFVDLEYLAYSTTPPMEILKEVANLMTYYYPERLYKSYMLFTPWVFSAVFTMIGPILPEKTQNKIINPGWYASESYNTFKNDIDKNQLIKRCGGNNIIKYNYEWELQQFNKLNPIEKQNNKNKNDNIIEEKNDNIKEEKNEEDDDDDDSKLCIVCLDGDRDHVMIPCGHIAV
eukprot:232713_1